VSTKPAGFMNSCGMWASSNVAHERVLTPVPRRLAQDLSHPLITMLQQECTRASCPEMKAGEWLYLCVAHGNDGTMEVLLCMLIGEQNAQLFLIAMLRHRLYPTHFRQCYIPSKFSTCFPLAVCPDFPMIHFPDDG
jgi:hypothetical protein